MREQEVLLEEILTSKYEGQTEEMTHQTFGERKKTGKTSREKKRRGKLYISRIFDETCLAQIGDDLQNCFCVLC
jgi:hypothetical protein